MQQVISTVNNNSAGIRKFSTNHAELSGPDFLVTLRGVNIAFERPKRLRIRARSIAQTELDLGSNDELFWIWLRRSPQQALYYCRHERYATSPIRQMLPVDPQWLIDALGISEFDPALPHQGPFPLKEGGLEIRTIRETPDGPMTKITVIDETKGTIVRQHLFNAQGRLVATSLIREHHYDPVSGLTMARKIEIRCPSAQFTMHLDLGNLKINRLAGNPQELWSMPHYDDYPLVDLSDPHFQVQPASVQSPVPPQGPPPSVQRPSRIRPPGMSYRGNRPASDWNRPSY